MIDCRSFGSATGQDVALANLPIEPGGSTTFSLPFKHELRHLADQRLHEAGGGRHRVTPTQAT